MSLSPTESGVGALTRPAAVTRPLSGAAIAALARWRGWGRNPLRGFRAPHQLFVQPGQVWHWDAQFVGAPHAGHERRTSQRPRRHNSLAEWFAAHPGSDARVVLSCRLTHHVLVQDRSMPLFEAVDVERYARHQFVHYHGTAAKHWPLAVWLHGAQRGASALHGLDLPMLKSDAGRGDVRLRSIEPAWSPALRFAMRQAPRLPHEARAAVALVEGTHVCWMVCERGALVALNQRMLASPDAAALATLVDELRREDSDLVSVHLVGYGIEAEGIHGATLLLPLQADHTSLDWLAP